MLALPLPAGPGGVEWHIRLEDGGERRGRAERRTRCACRRGLPLGYHRLAIAAGGTQAEIDLIVAPRIVPPAGSIAARGAQLGR